MKAIIAKSFNRVHPSNLASTGIVPLCFKPGEDAETLGLTGHERYTIHLPSNINEIKPRQDITVTTDTSKSFACTLRLETEVNHKKLCLDLIVTILTWLMELDSGGTGILQSWRDAFVYHQKFEQ